MCNTVWQMGTVAAVELALSRITDPSGEGAKTFTRAYRDEARVQAHEAERRITAGRTLSTIDGLPISIKDLFDVVGEVTRAGSVAIEHRPAAERDATVVARLKSAGAVLMGRTNMSEFAFTGVGINPHFGTPANPWDRATRRVPGGSSSGAPVSVTDGMAVAAIGTDTGGSVRIPAALCGIVGFKPTACRVPLDGVFPLSPNLDSAGVLAKTVELCAQIDAVLSAEPWSPSACDITQAKLAVATNYFTDEMDPAVARAFDSALLRLSRAGAKLAEIRIGELSDISAINARGGLSSPEAFAFHRRIGTNFDLVDPRVRERILRGGEVSAADYLDMLHAREAVRRSFERAHGKWDAILCPTVPIVAPEIAVPENNADAFRQTNRLLLRNPGVVNFLDRCALTLPCHAEGEPPAGIMLIGRRMADRELLSLGKQIEKSLS
jgi:aspartyl-tRNA(Asn)/glutamyl-tRNA(Gln) amidotransferase subunit A